MTDEEVLDALRVLYSYQLSPRKLVEMVDQKDVVSDALETLAELPRPLLVRWADPNYG